MNNAEPRRCGNCQRTEKEAVFATVTRCSRCYSYCYRHGYEWAPEVAQKVTVYARACLDCGRTREETRFSTASRCHRCYDYLRLHGVAWTPEVARSKRWATDERYMCPQCYEPKSAQARLCLDCCEPTRTRNASAARAAATQDRVGESPAARQRNSRARRQDPALDRFLNRLPSHRRDATVLV